MMRSSAANSILGTALICATFVLFWMMFILYDATQESSGMEKEELSDNSKPTVSNEDVTKWQPPDEWRPYVESKCNSNNCKPPGCFCAGTKGPLNVSREKIPQMVMLTFDDGISDEVYEYLDKLLSKPRFNPNGCPVTLTFYVSHTWTNHVGEDQTDYKYVRELYESGHEIASHTISHMFPVHKWSELSTDGYRREFGKQKQNIIKQAGIPEEDVKGMRIPFLALGGDNSFRMMKDEGLMYDATMVTDPHDDGGVWPFTLNFPVTSEFSVESPRPKSRYPGLWEVPLNSWIGVDGNPCWLVDFCDTQPKDKEESLAFMRYNFNRFYNRNRAPLGIHIHVAWFRDDISHFHALDEFLDDLTKLNDVYLVSASQVIEWMKDPQTVDGARSFIPWQRSCEMKSANETL